jgi:hypothetical protein
MVWAFFLLSIWLIWRRARSFRSINSQKRTGYEIFQQAIALSLSRKTIGFYYERLTAVFKHLGAGTANGLTSFPQGPRLAYILVEHFFSRTFHFPPFSASLQIHE